MYTAKQVRVERISFKPMSREQFDKLKAHFEKLYPGNYSNCNYDSKYFYRLYPAFNGEEFASKMKTYLGRTDGLESSKEISFEEFDFEEFVLPKTWYMQLNAESLENLEIAEAWIGPNMYNLGDWTVVYHNKDVSDMRNLKRGYTEITFEQFKRYVLKEDTGDKRIIGYKCPIDLFGGKVKAGTLFQPTSSHHTPTPMYLAVEGSKLINPTYALPAEIVTTWEPVFEEQFKAGDWVVGFHLPNHKFTTTAWEIGEIEGSINRLRVAISKIDTGCVTNIENLRKATPEEIAAAQIQVVRMGGEYGFDLTIKSGKVFHKSEDITSYVEELSRHAVPVLGARNFTSYAFVPKDLIISETGCENKETRLSEWVALYKLIKP